MAAVLGVDGDRRGWIGVVLEAGRFRSAHLTSSLEDQLAAVAGRGEGVDVVAIDMPIGWADGIRQADAMVRKLLPGKASSVFNSPPAVVRDTSSHAEANAQAKAVTGKGLSAQSWALVAKIKEATRFARSSEIKVVEAHPELSFAMMAGGIPAGPSKQSWAGHRDRIDRLARVGIQIPDDLDGAGVAGIADVVDAAAVAWTAARVATGAATSLPDPPEVDIDGMPLAVWY
jgi:predicted RNase H-like nuclease